MKKAMLTVGLLISSSVYAALGSQVTTSKELVGEISIQNSSSIATYYFKSEDNNWSAPNCPNAIYAFIRESAPGAKAILSTALAAKATNKPIQFGGICGNGSGNDQYIQINQTIL